MTSNPQDSAVLTARDLTISLDVKSALRPAIVYKLNVSIFPGECVGIVGESGSGKSLSGLAMLNLLPAGTVISDGDLRFGDVDLRRASGTSLRALRGKEVSMVFQDPASALNPTRTIRKQLVDIVKRHEKLSATAAIDRAVEALEDVGFANARSRLNDFPFQLSGGLKQRVAIAMALICKPKLVIADEPTTNLDVSVQAGILTLIRSKIDSDGFACIFVSHDLGVIAAVADRVMVMYAGEVVESGPVFDVLTSPQHPYTRGLISSAPTMNSSRDHPLKPYLAGRPEPSSTRPPSVMQEVAGQPGHLVRVAVQSGQGGMPNE